MTIELENSSLDEMDRRAAELQSLETVLVWLRTLLNSPAVPWSDGQRGQATADVMMAEATVATLRSRLLLSDLV